MFADPVQWYPIITGGARQPDLTAALAEIGGPDAIWEPPQHALLWVADHRCAMHVMMAVEGRLKADKLILVPLGQRADAETLLEEAYPGQPYRWVYAVVVAFSSAAGAAKFERAHEQYITAQMKDPTTARLVSYLEDYDDEEIADGVIA
ncbi:MAG: hypothetical protein P4M09_12920 [Devosia sp.]|nr:hypothetical protein [Devosia sp.]